MLPAAAVISCQLLIGLVVADDETRGAAAVEAAAGALRPWRALTPYERQVPLRKTAELIRRKFRDLPEDEAEALDRLVSAGSVILYAMKDGRAWRLSLGAGGAAAVQQPFPGWFHEMSAATVPEHYIRGLNKAPDGPGMSAIVWGVQLPASTRDAIASLTQGRPGGELVIRGDGRVLLEN